jgi:Histidine kinase-, DNA gyrase B-, and HSP90-like ATPase
MDVMVSRIELGALRRAPQAIAEPVIVGKDIFELFAGAMYAEPLSIYREYVQNAADALDEARSKGLSGPGPNDVEIWLDHSERSVRIRDLGVGVPGSHFVKRLTSIGASRKRGTAARGFRGIGRLSGLGYCQELVFRSRAKGDAKVKEMVWDGRALRDRLRSTDYDGSLSDLIKEVATVGDIPGAEYPAHFFEVEMRKLLRVKNDVLLNEEAVRSYLSQVAPVPFSPNFKLGRKIQAWLSDRTKSQPVSVVLHDGQGPIYHRATNSFPVSPKVFDEFRDVTFLEYVDSNGDALAVGWTLDHSYAGAISRKIGLGGIRLRKGDVQVGDEQLLSFVFPEARFAQWVVGDIHVVHSRIVPNGRRDDFEHSPALAELQEHLRDLGRTLTANIRERSDQRTKLKKVQLALQYAETWRLQSVEAQSPAIAAAAAERADHFSELARKALSKLNDAVAEKDRANQQASRLESELEKWRKKNARRFAAVNPMQKAALTAVLSSSVKATEVMPLAMEVGRAMTKASRKA